MSKLDRQERALLKSVERGEWKSTARLVQERKQYQEYAKATFKKDRRINIRIATKDLEAIQQRAVEERIPYQTLIPASCISTFPGDWWRKTPDGIRPGPGRKESRAHQGGAEQAKTRRGLGWNKE